LAFIVTLEVPLLGAHKSIPPAPKVVKPKLTEDEIVMVWLVVEPFNVTCCKVGFRDVLIDANEPETEPQPLILTSEPVIAPKV